MGIKKATVKNLQTFFKSTQNVEKTLDVGCGDSPYRRYLYTDHYVGIDVQESGRDNKNPTVWFDGVSIPFDDDYFDFILCTEVLEHATEPELLMAEMVRVLKPEGHILITVPSMWGLHEMPYDFRRYTTEGLKKLISRFDLKIIILEKEDLGYKSLIKLGLSENRNAKQENGILKYMIVKFLLLALFTIFKVLDIKMPRIYLSNQLLVKK